MKQTFKLLIFEDNTQDFKILKHYLDSNINVKYETKVVQTLNEGLVELSKNHSFDAILLDLNLFDSIGIQTFRTLYKEEKLLPIIALSETADEDLAMRIVQEGAQNYIVKNELNGSLLHRMIQFSIERKKIEVRLTELNYLKNKFLKMASHDLRNPLTMIINATELINITFEQHKIRDKEMLHYVQKSSQRMLALIEDLLDITIIESGSLTMSYSLCDNHTFLTNCYKNNILNAQEKNITLHKTPSEESFLIEMDINRMEQVMDNLIGNAIKFSHENTTIDISLEKQGDQAILTVIDQGQGIPENELPLLFDNSSPLSVKTTKNEKSTSIGLKIVKKLIEIHNGTIEVSSKVSKGTTIKVSIPLTQVMIGETVEST